VTGEGTRPASGYPAIIPYLLVADANALIRFFEAAFGAVARFKVPSESGGVVHAEVALGDGVMMISDAGEVRGPGHFCHYVADADAAFLRAIQAGAVTVSEPETKEYGDRVAGVKDPAGNVWWICARMA
jgi:uncharacterized glyoxalase superfamily protein PhnB